MIGARRLIGETHQTILFSGSVDPIDCALHLGQCPRFNEDGTLMMTFKDTCMPGLTLLAHLSGYINPFDSSSTNVYSLFRIFRYPGSPLYMILTRS